MRAILLVRCGHPAPSVRIVAGDYDRWFVRALGAAGLRFRVVDAPAGEEIPDGADAIVVTGSPSSVIEDAPWMRRAGDRICDLAAGGVPVLGVCFGHQLLARAYGGEVERSPRGRELGTVACRLTPAGRGDPLFRGIPDRFAVQATHEDHVARLPPGAELLATNAHSQVQAFAIGRTVRAVQFHPEVDTATMRALVLARTPAVKAEAHARGEPAEDGLRAALDGVRESPHARRVLENFVDGFAPSKRRPTSPGGR